MKLYADGNEADDGSMRVRGEYLLTTLTVAGPAG